MFLQRLISSKANPKQEKGGWISLAGEKRKRKSFQRLIQSRKRADGLASREKKEREKASKG